MRRATVCLFLAAWAAASAAYADVALKIVTVNPSQTETKKAKIKTYLPEEATAADVVSNGGLEVGYDAERKCYFVAGEAELAPGQNTEREVVLRDVWKIAETDLDARRADAVKIAAALAASEFSEKAAALRDGVKERLERVAASQKTPAASPREHIARFRENRAVLAQVDADLAVARTLMLSAKRLPASNIWMLITAVCGFLAVIAGGMYFFWQAQLKQDGMLGGADGKRAVRDLSEGGRR